MNISSAQPTYSITSSDTITIDLSNVNGAGCGGYASDTITLSGGSGYTIGTGISSITLTNTTSGAGGFGSGFIAQTIDSIDPSIVSWKNEEFVDCLPDIRRIEEMCKTYPGLKIAYEKFVTTYRLVKDDFDTPPDKRAKP